MSLCEHPSSMRDSVAQLNILATEYTAFGKTTYWFEMLAVHLLNAESWACGRSANVRTTKQTYKKRIVLLLASHLFPDEVSNIFPRHLANLAVELK
jgi:hypothetical protein